MFELEGTLTGGEQSLAAPLSVEQFAHVLATLARKMKDEQFGAFARPAPLGSYATMLDMSVECTNLGSALRVAQAFYSLLCGSECLILTESEGQVRLTTRPNPSHLGLGTFVHLLGIWRMLTWLSGELLGTAILGLNSSLAPCFDQARQLFACETTIVDGPSHLRLDASVLELLVPRETERPQPSVETRFLGLFRPPAPTGLELCIRDLLASSLPERLTIADVANRLGLSISTLHRRLKSRGHSYRQVKTKLMTAVATEALAEGESPIEVCARLGFSESSSFQRAFKAWVGVSPARYQRAKLRCAHREKKRAA